MTYRIKANCYIDNTYEIEAESINEAYEIAEDYAKEDLASSLSLEAVDEDGCPIEE